MAHVEGMNRSPNSTLKTSSTGQKYWDDGSQRKAAAQAAAAQKQAAAARTGGGGGYVAPAAAPAPAPAAPAFDEEAYLAQLQAQMLAEQRARAQEAYNRNMGRIADAYNNGISALQGNLNTSKQQLGIARDASNKDITRDAESSLRAAYINNMMSKRDMRQNMSAQGLNGGAAESTMASISNNYGTSRNNIETTRNRNIEDLERTYNNNIAQAQMAYNQAAADLYSQKMAMEMQAENALNNMMDSYSSDVMSLVKSNPQFLSALNSAQANQAAYALDPTQATNIYSGVAMQQAAPTDAGSNYAQYLAQQALQANGVQTLRNNLSAMGFTPAQIAQYFAGIGLAA